MFRFTFRDGFWLIVVVTLLAFMLVQRNWMSRRLEIEAERYQKTLQLHQKATQP